MPEEMSPLEYVSEITELNDICVFMQDPVIDEAMSYVVRLISKPDVKSDAVPRLLVKLQALAGACALKAKYYTVFEKGGDAGKRKHAYYTMENALNNLVNALKYSARNG